MWQPLDICAYCLAKRETPGHFTNQCCAFHNTRTKGHNEAWEATTAAIRARLPSTLQLHLDVPMKKVPLQLAPVHSWQTGGPGEQHGTTKYWSVDQLGELQPDAIVIEKAGKAICILEYTQPSDTRPAALYEAAARKTSKYQVLQAALLHYGTTGWKVHLFPLPVGVCDSLLHAHWIPALETLGVPQAHFREVLQAAATASVRATHMLHVC